MRRMSTPRKLRYGMVGGGPGAFIGEVHRRAVRLDGLADLVAGSFSSDGARSAEHGRDLGLSPSRVYGSYAEMAEAEAALPDDERIDFVSVVTPNHLHHPVARAFLERGIHVVCDKPITTTVDDAESLCRLADERGLVFALTHNYTGYPLVKQARALVAGGRLGEVRKVVVEYSQGWLATALEAEGQKQASWRTDPVLAGAGALGDIGTHGESLARYVTGLEMERLCADVRTVVPGRRVDDDASVLVRYAGGAAGVLHCTQVAAGEENDLRLRVQGSGGSLEWRQQEPNVLHVRPAAGPAEIHRPGHEHLAPAARRASRLPAGHPEGFMEAFANVYANAIRTIAARMSGDAPDPMDLDFPTARDGAVGVHFVHAALRSAEAGGWVDARYAPPGG